MKKPLIALLCTLVSTGAAAGGEFDLTRFALGLLGFCLTNSAIYAFNDVLDAENDRRHPEKRNRPVAARRIGPFAAVASAEPFSSTALSIIDTSSQSSTRMPQAACCREPLRRMRLSTMRIWDPFFSTMPPTPFASRAANGR